jgi:hypothetical protein
MSDTHPTNTTDRRLGTSPRPQCRFHTLVLVNLAPVGSSFKTLNLGGPLSRLDDLGACEAFTGYEHLAAAA